jgi:hypothetical protein
VTRSNAPALALFLAVSLAALPAAAQEDDSKTLFAAGRELRAAGRCEPAIVAFRRALDINPQGLGSLRNIAECEEQLGHLASARRSYWDLRRAVLQTNETKYQGWDKDAEAAYQRLGARVPKLTVRLKGRELERVRVTVDGKPLDPRLVGAELERDLGPHTVAANYGGAAPVTKRVDLAEAARETVVLEIPDPTAAHPRPEAVPLPGEGSSALRTAGVVALTVGGVALVGGLVSLFVRQNAAGDVEDLCPGYEDADACVVAKDDVGTLESARDRAQTTSTLVTVFGGVAIAGIGAGVTLAILGADDDGGTEVQPTNPAPTAKKPNARAPVSAPKRAWFGVSTTFGGAMARAKVTF